MKQMHYDPKMLSYHILSILKSVHKLDTNGFKLQFSKQLILLSNLTALNFHAKM